MCMTTQAFALFLSLLSPEIVETGPERVTIHATARSAVWHRVGDEWCTDLPGLGGEVTL